MYPPGYHPHEGDPRVDPQARVVRMKQVKRAPSVAQQKRALERGTMGPEGFFGSTQPAQPVEVIEPEFQPPVGQPRPEPRETSLKKAYRFREGAPLYRVQRDFRTERIIVPRVMEVADDLFMGRLPMSFELNMDSEHLVMGKKGKPVPEIVGKSSLGAFAVADVRNLEIIDEYGDPVDLALVDMRDRRLRSQNEVVRFRREVSGELYYLSLPRPSGRHS
jgi:hypothetical protein